MPKNVIVPLIFCFIFAVSAFWYFGHHRPAQEMQRAEPVRTYKPTFSEPRRAKEPSPATETPPPSETERNGFSATSGDHSFIYKGSSAPWQTELRAFHKLLKTDASAARAELHAFAERIFGEHALVEEWVPLYFRIRKDGTTHLSDLKRVSELEIRMLEHIDPEKYAEQIQHHQKKIKRSSVSRQKGNESAPTGALKGQWSSPTLTAFESGGEFFINFVNLLTTDLKAARAELNKYASQRYGDHPHKAEWTELVFRNFRDKKSKILDLMRLYELEKQMLTDIDPEKYADGIKNLERIIKIHERLQRNFERQGTPNPTIGVEYNLTTED